MILLLEFYNINMLIFNIKRNEIAFFIKVSLEPFHGQKFASQIGLRRRIYLCGSSIAEFETESQGFVFKL